MKKLVYLFLLLIIFPYFVFAKTCNTNNIVIKKIEQKNKSENVEEKTNATIENNIINLDIQMSNVEDYIEYELSIENNSNEDLILNENFIKTEDNYFNYVLTYEDDINQIKSKETKTITLTISYSKKIEENNFENGVYQTTEIKKIELTDLQLENPNTSSHLIEMVLVMGIILILGKKIIKKYKILFIVLILIPFGVDAICSYELELKSNIEVINTPTISSLNIGEYVSLTPDLETFTILEEDTGYNVNQTMNPKDLNLWRIISKNEDGTVDAVSEYVSTDTVAFVGIIGYANLINEFQKIAQAYRKEGYTDSTRLMGYDGQTPVIVDRTSFDGSSNIAPDPLDSQTVPTSGEGKEFREGLLGDTLYLKDYQLIKNVYGNVLGYQIGSTTPVQYWISSRRYIHYDDTKFNFSARRINDNGSIGSYGLRRYDDNSWANYMKAYPVRPIITINKTIKISDGDGTLEQPYSLEK